MSKIKCCKNAPVFEIQYDVLFRQISVRQLRMTDRTQTWHTTFLQSDEILQLFIFDIASNLLTLHTPQRNNYNK